MLPVVLIASLWCKAATASAQGGNPEQATQPGAEALSWIHAVLRGSLELVCQPCCGICRQAIGSGSEAALCEPCRGRLALPAGGLQGQWPLPWWSLGHYEGPLRQLLLRQRTNPQPRTLRSLAGSLRQTLPAELQGNGRIVAIPSWKQRGCNPLPQLICQGLGLPEIQPLRRRRPTLGQHHLNRAMRALNQADAFRCQTSAIGKQPGWRRQPILIVDDILTTGATANAAAVALQDAGFRVAGLLCLARTPAPGRDLRSSPATSAASRDSSVGRAGD